VKVESDSATLLMEGMKSNKDTLFFLTPESGDEKPKKNEKKTPMFPRTNGSPPKLKTIGEKVWQNQMCSAHQDEVHMTTAVKIVEHQREL